MADWYSVATPDETERLVGAWVDAPIENEEVCALILSVAKRDVLTYGPVLADGAAVPDGYVYGQLQQAQNLWNAGRVSTGGDGGVDGFTFTPRPLDQTVKKIIRPVHGGPRVR